MDYSLNQLNHAIDDRISKENEFINRIVEEFRQISIQLQRTADNSPPSQQGELQGAIERINVATNDLNTRPFTDQPVNHGSSFFSGLTSGLSRMRDSLRSSAQPSSSASSTQPASNEDIFYDPDNANIEGGKRSRKRRTRGGWKSTRRSRRPIRRPITNNFTSISI